MQENIDQNSWKYRIAEQIVSSYKTDTMSQHIFEKVIIKELLWHATTMIKGRKVNTKGELGDKIDMINIKIVGQRYWSEDAVKEYKIANPPEKKNWKTVTKGTLIHEHAVPRKIIKEKIINILDKQNNSNKNSKIKEVYEIINKYSKSVVVTKDEDKKLNEKGLKQKMPKDWDEKKWYARYEKSGINIIDLDEGKKIPYNKKFKDIMYKIKK